MRDLDEVLAALAQSPFRRRFRLRQKELDYLRDKGLEVALRHAADEPRERRCDEESDRNQCQTIQHACGHF